MFRFSIENVTVHQPKIGTPHPLQVHQCLCPASHTNLQLLVYKTETNQNSWSLHAPISSKTIPHPQTCRPEKAYPKKRTRKFVRYLDKYEPHVKPSVHIPASVSISQDFKTIKNSFKSRNLHGSYVAQQESYPAHR